MSIKPPTRQRVALLVLRAQAGDRQALDRLLEIHQRDLFGYLTKMLPCQADAEDVLQQTLIQAVKKITWLREPNYFRAWVFRIASRMAFRVIKRSQKNREHSNEAYINDIADDEHMNSVTAGLIEQIPQWLERLTPKGREAVILHYLRGFTTEEVAEILDIPVGTAKSRISYSLACIRKQLSNQRR